MSKIKVLTVQIGWTEDIDDNLNRAIGLIEEGLSQYGNADIVCLPEFFYKNPTRKNKTYIGESLDYPFFHAFSEAAAKHHVNIVTGTFPENRDGEIYNTALCIDRQGRLIGNYSKAHLFDAFDRKESDILAAGKELGIVDFDFGRVGIAVCYELRFPEYLRTLALKGIDLLVVPSAFYRPREAQWEILIRGAALGNLCYVAAANQYNRYCFGRSMICDPCGLTLAQAPDREGVICTVIDTDYQKEIRKQTAAYENRRPDLYEI